MYFRALSAVALALSGCAAFEDPGPEYAWNHSLPEQACGPGDPRLRPDGVCCPTWEPDWRGPDSAGYYCQPKPSDPDDPMHQMVPP